MNETSITVKEEKTLTNISLTLEVEIMANNENRNSSQNRQSGNQASGQAGSQSGGSQDRESAGQRQGASGGQQDRSSASGGTDFGSQGSRNREEVGSSDI
jgi:hypothetical protein